MFRVPSGKWGAGMLMRIWASTCRGIACHRDEQDLQQSRPRSVSQSTVISPGSIQSIKNNDAGAIELVDRLTARVKELETALRHAQSTPSPSSILAVESAGRRESAATAGAVGGENVMVPPIVPQQESPAISADSLKTEQTSPSGVLVNSEVENAATILEFLAWGRRKDPDYSEIVTKEDSSSSLRRPPGDVGAANGTRKYSSDEKWLLSGGLKESSLPCLQLLLPNRLQLIQIVDYHRHCLLWYHGSFHSMALAAEVDDFLKHHHNGSVENLGDIDLQWLAMLFSVMCGSMACAPRTVARSWGFGKSEQITLANRWFEATAMCLNLADYAAVHSIYSVQAIATLTIAAHMLGHSNRQSVLLASAVRVAQNLGLHRLGHEVEEGQSPDLVKHEIGRRAWAQLCVQDWFNIPFSETYLIHGPSFNTDKPRNCLEEDMRSLSDEIATDMTYNRILYDVAALMPPLQDRLTMSNTLYTKYEQVMQADTQMRILVTKHIPYHLKNVPIEEHWPCYVPWARRALTFSLSHKIIMIHRKFLGLSFTNPAFEFTRKTCVAAAKTIAREQIRSAREASKDSCPVLWVYHAFSVAASVRSCPSPLSSHPSNSFFFFFLEDHSLPGHVSSVPFR